MNRPTLAVPAPAPELNHPSLESRIEAAHLAPPAAETPEHLSAISAPGPEHISSVLERVIWRLLLAREIGRNAAMSAVTTGRSACHASR
jgi:hypothetical protein